eukprot:TRINITY_DN67604_c11_g7_i1.p1 TRINITY_DN67604_c11_g7~~TRINITY_DN67604_c11_g7_i1.p1  ORF type:complete len:247 (+),score=9.02 TRINITY_DN67604_c11_g7_i1:36-776(+)
MFLRQIALATSEQSQVAAAFEKFGRTKRVFSADPIVGPLFGISHQMLPLSGGTFVEVLSPVRDNAPVAKFLKTRGPSAGFLLMLQVPDQEEVKRRMAQIGVRIGNSFGHDGAKAVHWHPQDLGGILLETTEVTPESKDTWPWVGPDSNWMDKNLGVGMLCGIQLTVPDPSSTCSKWAQGLGLPMQIDRQHNTATLSVNKQQTIKFVRGTNHAFTNATIIAATPTTPHDEAVIGGVHFAVLSPTAKL